MLRSGTILIAAIARRLEVSRDTFYRYFPQARIRSQAAAADAVRQARCSSGASTAFSTSSISFGSPL
jgi:DNA invertase Pin-like site-specific DNA recombinase